MKKGLIITTTIALTLFVVSLASVSATNNYANLNGIEITQKQYDKLKSVGYTDKEIETLNREKYDKVMNMEIISQNVNSTYGYYDKIDENNNQNGIIASNRNYLNDENEHSYNKGGYVKVDMFGTYYRNRGTQGEFFVKVNVDYDLNVKNRLEDIIGINFGDNIQSKYEYISGSQRPKFEAKLTYTEDYYCRDYTTTEKITQYTKEHEVIYHGDDLNQYQYYIDKGLIVKFDLPSNYNNDSSSSQIKQEKHINYYDFYMTLEGDFVPKQAGINSTTFAGISVIQNEGGGIDWKKIKLTTTPPYFEYNDNWWWPDPHFEQPVGTLLMFQDLYKGN